MHDNCHISDTHLRGVARAAQHARSSSYTSRSVVACVSVVHVPLNMSLPAMIPSSMICTQDCTALTVGEGEEDDGG